MASPSRHLRHAADLLEPILFGHAARAGHPDRFNTEYLSLRAGCRRRHRPVRDRSPVTEYAIRAKYLIGADGGRFEGRRGLGLPIEGQMGVGGSMNILLQGGPLASSGTGQLLSGFCSPEPMSAESAWAWCAWSGRGTNG